jgi:hypothetical protein
MSHGPFHRIYPAPGSESLQVTRLLDDLEHLASGACEMRAVSNQSWRGTPLAHFLFRAAIEGGFVVARARLDEGRRLYGSRRYGKALFVELMRSVATKAGEWGCLEFVVNQLAELDPGTLLRYQGTRLDGVRDYCYRDVLQEYCLAARSGASKKKALCVDWLSGKALERDEYRFLGVRSGLDCAYAVDRLFDFAQVVQAAGFPGLLLVVEGMESIQQLRGDIRVMNHMALIDICNRLHSGKRLGCLVVLTGSDDSIRNRRTGLHASEELRHGLVDNRDVFDPQQWRH